MPDATTWLRRVNQHPEKYGISRAHILRVDRDVRHIMEADEKALRRAEKWSKANERNKGDE